MWNRVCDWLCGKRQAKLVLIARVSSAYGPEAKAKLASDLADLASGKTDYIIVPKDVDIEIVSPRQGT